MRRSITTVAAFLLTLFSFLALPGLYPTAQAQDNRLLGDWQNVNAETRGITKVRIFSTDNRVRIRVWGKCHPTDCDWGVVEGYAEGDNVSSDLSTARIITATYNHGFSVTNLVIRLYMRERIRVEVHTRFTDSSGRAPYHSIELLAKGESVRARSAVFAGAWRNADEQTRGITAVQITGRGNQFNVRVWGKCHPTDCDWGSVEGFAEGRSVNANPNEARVLTATFENSFSVKTLFIRLLDNNRLQVEIHTRFTDNSGRSAYRQTYVLNRN